MGTRLSKVISPLGAVALVATTFAAVAAVAGKPAQAERTSATPLEINPRLLRRFAPLHARFDAPGRVATAAQTELGRMLFYDARLSVDKDLSCNSCHRLDRHGVDGERFSRGRNGHKTRRNSPTVFNAAGQFLQFWDGRAGDVETQATYPIMNPEEMAMPDRKSLEARLLAVPAYVAAFQAAFPNDAHPLTLENVAIAIASFERGLSTPAPWDHYLEGDSKALSQVEKDGFRVFSDLGCASCHDGEFVGGASFRRLGAVNAWPNRADFGRAEVTKLSNDRMVFKVPSLRNVTKTAPYFHDGRVADLATAVRMMGTHQLDIDLDEEDVKAIVTWLDSLTGEVDTRYVAEPSLPR